MIYYSAAGDEKATTSSSSLIKNATSTTQPKEVWGGTKVGELNQAFYQAGRPLDDLWITKSDVLGKTLVPKPDSKSKTVFLTDWFENPTNRKKKFVSRKTFFKGSYVYFIPKDENGKVIGEPIKLVKVDYTLDIMPDGSFRPISNSSDTFRSGSSKPAYFLYEDVAPAYQSILKDSKEVSEFAINLAKKRTGVSTDAIASQFSGVAGDYKDPRYNYTPNVSSRFTGIDDIRKEMNKYGANGDAIELSNIEGLDESIANVMGMEMDLGVEGRNIEVRAKAPAPKIVKKDGAWKREGDFAKGDIMQVVDKRPVKFYCSMRKKWITRTLLIFSDNSASVPPKWERISNAGGGATVNPFCETKKSNDIKECDNNYANNMNNPATAATAYNTYKVCVNSALATYNKCRGKSNADGGLDFDNDYANFTNESLLDGMTENTSLLNADGYNAYSNDYSNLVNQSLLDGLTENTSFLEAEGGFWSRLFGGGKKEETVVEGDNQVVDGATVDKAYAETGAKEGKSFKDWLKGDKAKNALNTALQVANMFLVPKTATTTTTGGTGGTVTTTTATGTGDLGGGTTTINDDKSKEKDKFLGMPKAVGITVAVVGGLALIAGGIFIVKKMNK